MRSSPAKFQHIDGRAVLQVVALDRFGGAWRPEITFAVRVSCGTELSRLTDIFAAGVRNVAALTADPTVFADATMPSILDGEQALESGDVIALTPGVEEARVLFRESDIHHTVFITNRCNSNCLMCSQPPTRQDDSWLIDESIALASHMRLSPESIGFTGGEPLLLGGDLRKVLDAFRREHPASRLEILTNGRLLSDRSLANEVLSGLDQHVMWMVPLYGHADFLHDFVVQSHGAFDQTIDGLLTLREYRKPIQLRTVLIEPVLGILPDFCEFIGRNLPFVREVALMGCEPVGFALANRERCQVDLADWAAQLVESVSRLHRTGLPVILMNIPLCALPEKLWQYTHRSISDWKNVYADECCGCTVKPRCCGLFAWHEKGWRPTTIRPIVEGTNHEAV